MAGLHGVHRPIPTPVLRQTPGSSGGGRAGGAGVVAGDDQPSARPLLDSRHDDGGGADVPAHLPVLYHGPHQRRVLRHTSLCAGRVRRFLGMAN